MDTRTRIVSLVGRSYGGALAGALRASSSSSVLVACALGLATTGTTAAQGGAGPPTLLVSTSSDVPSGASWPFVDEAALARVGGSAPARVQLGEGHWQAVAGAVPGDVDALARRPGFAVEDHRGWLFSLLSNEAGALDGDLLALAPGGGFETVVAEGDLAAGLGLPQASIDVDAATYDDQGRLWFSLQSNLAGTLLGDVADGDVLRLEADGSVTRPLTEADVTAKLQAATGTASSAGDVIALEFQGGEPWLVVQSPSSHDGAVLSCGSTPAVVLDEAEVGLDGAELDALLWLDPGEVVGRVLLSAHQAAPGDALQAEFAGGGPGHALLVLAAGGVGYAPSPGFGGFGAVYVDLGDPWLGFQLSGPALPIALLDGSGGLVKDFSLPVNRAGGTGWGGGAGWSFQTIDLVTLEISAPFRIQL